MAGSGGGGAGAAAGQAAGAVPPGFLHLPGRLGRAAQAALLAEVWARVEPEFWFTPTMPRSNRPFSVRMANLGALGWISDAAGYRYAPRHPVSGRSWPPMPEALLLLWREIVGGTDPECCLVNLYRAGARMGLHQDRDEAALAVPVLSVSLGDAAIFRVGGTERRARTVSLRLESGDVVVLGGAARLCFHGVDRILNGTSDLVPGGGRINLTLRRVTVPG